MTRITAGLTRNVWGTDGGGGIDRTGLTDPWYRGHGFTAELAQGAGEPCWMHTVEDACALTLGV